MSETYEQIRRAMDIAIEKCKEMNRYPSCYVMTEKTRALIQDCINKNDFQGKDPCEYPSHLYGIKVHVFDSVAECLEHMATRSDTYRPCFIYTESEMKEVSAHPWFFKYMMNLVFGDVAPIDKDVVFEFKPDGELSVFPKKATGNQEVIYGKNFRKEDLK